MVEQQAETVNMLRFLWDQGYVLSLLHNRNG